MLDEPINLPTALPWECRVNAIYPLPGGYSGYLASLTKICQRIEEGSPSWEELVDWTCESFDISETSSRGRLNSLRTSGLIGVSAGLASVDGCISDWLRGAGDHIPIAVIHRHVRFIGEMLAALQEPKSAEGLREIAEDYGLNWDSLRQIDNRRGWLESAKLIEGTNRRLNLTSSGLELVGQLDVYEPEDGIVVARRSTAVPANEIAEVPAIAAPADYELETRLRDLSIDSSNHRDFELTVRDAFEFLGFKAEHFGGSGKTDVLLTAPLGKGNTYRVAVDAKTTASGSLGDHQVDWGTLEEHRHKHGADHSLLVAPNPTGKRLMDRAKKSNVAVLSAEQLADLCHRHRDAAISLVTYRQLFRDPGEVNPTGVDERVDHVLRLRGLAGALCQQLPEKTGRFGPMSARDVQLALGALADGVSEEEISGLLEMLAHPLIGVVHSFPDRNDRSAARYVLATSHRSSQALISALADQIARSDMES